LFNPRITRIGTNGRRAELLTDSTGLRDFRVYSRGPGARKGTVCNTAVTTFWFHWAWTPVVFSSNNSSILLRLARLTVMARRGNSNFVPVGGR
jgi:hypothetical protein